ncbi:MAG: hypothetical protein VKI81_04440 [Synechococcaceae cyanobacterium]|nr:hypothetical protein [Synechococcaceae cyanobacterium]
MDTADRHPVRSLLRLGAAFAVAAGAFSLPAGAQTLYRLTTTCSLKGGADVPCEVEAVDVGEATEYRHRMGGTTVTYRVFDDPHVRIEGLNPSTRRWTPVRNATIRFSRNQLCFNDRTFCVVNPNYLNSVREEAGPAFAGRDLVGLAFGSGGRVEVACYDAGCRRLKEALGR